MDNIKISIAKDFSITPGPRYKKEGPFSGEEFKEKILNDAFSKALENGIKIVVDLDGTIGYGTSFLEEVFGGLAREKGIDNVKKTIEVISNEEKYLIDDIDDYITHANEKH